MEVIKEHEKRVKRLRAELKHARLTVTGERLAIKSVRKTLKTAKQGQEILQTVAASVQQQAHDQIAGVVTRCLETVFDVPYEFRIEFTRKRGKTDAELVFYRDGNRVNPRRQGGGGCLDVAAFALRVAKLVLHKPAGRRVLIMDEPFRHVDRKNAVRLRELVLSLAKDFSIQFVLVTHDPVLAIGKVVTIG